MEVPSIHVAFSNQNGNNYKPFCIMEIAGYRPFCPCEELE
jgi:hypothetical protein